MINKYKIVGELAQHYFVYHKSYMDCPGYEIWPPHSEATFLLLKL